MENKPRVLVAHSDPRHLAAISRILQSGEMVALGASSGEECLETTELQLPDLILVGAALSDISGMDVIKELKRDPELAAVYAVLMFGEDAPSTSLARALDAGADGCLLQSMSDRELVAWVSALLRRKREADELRAAWKQWQSAMDAVSDPMFVVDTQWRISLCNVALSKALRLAPSQILGKRCYELIHAESEAMPGCLLRRVRETDHRETDVVATEDGWLQIIADPLRAEDGHIVGALHILSDVTEQKRAETAMRDAQDQLDKRVLELQAALNGVQEKLVAAEAAREETLQSLRETEFQLSQKTDELQGEVTKREQSEADLQGVKAELNTAVAVAHDLGQQLRRQQSALAAASEALQREVDRHQQTENLMKHHRQQKTVAVRAMANGLAGALHTLSSGLLGGAAAAMAQVDPAHPLYRELQRLQEGALGTLDLARDLLSLAGQRVIQMRPVNLNALVSLVNESLQLSLERQARTQLDLAPDVPLVQGDANALQLVLSTLVSEALRSTPATETVVISSAVVTLPEPSGELPFPEPTGTFVRLRFGIPQVLHDKDLDTYLDPFGAGQIAPKEGMALAVANGIAHQHQGYVVARSIADHGACLELYLPVLELVETQQVDNRSSESRSDDEPIVVPSEPVEGNDVKASAETAFDVRHIKSRVNKVLGRSQPKGS